MPNQVVRGLLTMDECKQLLLEASKLNEPQLKRKMKIAYKGFMKRLDKKINETDDKEHEEDLKKLRKLLKQHAIMSIKFLIYAAILPPLGITMFALLLLNMIYIVKVQNKLCKRYKEDKDVRRCRIKTKIAYYKMLLKELEQAKKEINSFNSDKKKARFIKRYKKLKEFYENKIKTLNEKLK